MRRFLDDPARRSQALFLLARCQLQNGDPRAAGKTLETLIDSDPAQVAAKVELAKLRLANKKIDSAIELLTQATNSQPEIDGNWLLLSDALRRDGQADASSNALRQFDMIKAFNEKLAAARHAFSSADFKTADTMCRQLLQLVPNESRTLQLLARIARQFQHYEFSTATLARCVEARPADVALRLDYAYSLRGSRRFQEALVQCRRLAELAPENLDNYELMAEVCYNLGQYEQAIEIYRDLATVPEREALSLLHLGKVLKTTGAAAEATACYRQVTDLQPGLGQAWWELANLKTYRFTDEEVRGMRQQLKSDGNKALDSVLIRFALGKALEDCGQYAASFEQYESANSGYLAIRPYRYNNQNARFKEVFSQAWFADRQGFGNPSKAPIFITGLPRSGSTLVEQILSRHSQVDATQELDEIVSIARSLSDAGDPAAAQYPESMANLDAARVRELAERYLEFVASYRQRAAYFVDKAPGNFLHIGLIKTLFPNARILDVRRNPLASGWSIYRQFFADSFHFSYDLQTIGQYFNGYIDLMAHWQTVLSGEILTVKYEDLVGDLRTTTGAILQFCGLPFEEACLDFHLSTRAVATPSSEQVRQPLYTDALEHWKNYDEFLAPLKQALNADELSLAS